MSSNEGVWDSVALLVIDGQRLIPEISLRRTEDFMDGVRGIRWKLNDVDITAEEYEDIQNDLFGIRGERQLVLSHKISESNIQEIILGT